jgi:hypothetical protein
MVITKQPINGQRLAQDHFQRQTSNSKIRILTIEGPATFFQQQRRQVTIVSIRESSRSDKATIKIKTSVLATLMGSKAKAGPIKIKIKAIGINRLVAIATSNIKTMSRNCMPSSSRETILDSIQFLRILPAIP